MFVVRYIAVAALALWLGGTAALIAGYASDELVKHATTFAYIMGAAILACLMVLKFVGPPPHAFQVRAALVVAMIVATAVCAFRRTPAPGLGVNLALGSVLLAWYARE